MRKYTQGVCMDGAAILCDGEMITVDQIVAGLNRAEELEKALRELINDSINFGGDNMTDSILLAACRVLTNCCEVTK